MSITEYCPVCSNQELRVIWHEGSFRARRCPTCGLIATGGEKLFHFDKSYYQVHLASPAIAKKRVEHFKRLIADLPVALSAPILDVGAGVGFFAQALPPDLAHSVVLVEPSEAARNFLEQAAIADTFASLDEVPGSYGAFNTVTFWDVLAHVGQPVDVLTAARRRIAQDGLLVIKTPHHPAALFRAAYALRPIRKGRALVHIPSMRFHFTPASLDAMLTRAGFAPFFWQWVAEPPVTARGAAYLKGKSLKLYKKLIVGRVSFVMLARIG